MAYRTRLEHASYVSIPGQSHGNTWSPWALSDIAKKKKVQNKCLLQPQWREVDMRIGLRFGEKANRETDTRNEMRMDR